MADRVTQVTARTLTSGSPSSRVSQLTVRVLSSKSDAARVTQLTVRVLSENVPDDVVSGRRRPLYLMS